MTFLVASHRGVCGRLVAASTSRRRLDGVLGVRTSRLRAMIVDEGFGTSRLRAMIVDEGIAAFLCSLLNKASQLDAETICGAAASSRATMM